MTGSPSSDLTATTAEGSTTPDVQSADSAGVCRIDFAHLADRQLLVYGWILGFTKLVNRALISLGGVTIDLTKQAILVRRPDVAQHFSLEAGNDAHGFYALVDLPVKIGLINRLTFTVNLVSGETVERVWPVSCRAGRASLAAPDTATLGGLLPHLPRRDAKRLVQFARPALGPQAEAEYLVALPPPARFEVDLCCVLENRILVVFGWLFDPLKELTVAQLQVGGSVYDLRHDSGWIARPDLSADPSFLQARGASRLPGFIFVRPIPKQDAESDEASFLFAWGTESADLIRPLVHILQEARRDFLSLLTRVDPDSALAVSERLTMALGNGPEQRSLGALIGLIRHNAVERLPPSIQHANPRYALHVDQANFVADKGVFLVGWFSAESTASVQVVCHCGSASFAVSDNWVRCRRLDVSSHLEDAGLSVGDHEHGYICYVPLCDGDAPYYLATVSASSEVHRMRVKLPEQQSTLQTVRALLNPFDSGKGELRILMERHIGPAVEAVWAAREKPARTPAVRNYGVRPASPSVSVIVPLYGRHDFVEYQMALFADDPEFQSVELIYVVDDPTIIKEFYSRSDDLYGIYQVPFLVVYLGSNLGYAGANNRGAEVARGEYLLLMNSDVMPKRRGWLGNLLRTHSTLSVPGLLGTKLLYEDGSVQHAGMNFRRLAAWDNLWTNHHPSKGQSPKGLSGVPEVAAVTAACALIETALYRELGGFSEDYIIGDFEDSDLCLRARGAGRRNYVALDIELYHLERQSQNTLGDVQWRTNMTVYNCLLHNRRWADLMEKISTGTE